MADERDENGLPIIEQAGQQFSLGCLPPDGIERHPKFGAFFDAIPVAKWQELSSQHFDVSIFNQGRTNSCTGQATAGAAITNRARARWKKVPLSPYSVYAIINSGRDAGATIGQALDAARKYGIGSAEKFPQQVLYKQQLTREMLQNMQKYRITEAFKVDSFEEAGTALVLGFDLVFGIAVGRNFGDLDGEEIAPVPDRVVGGHALYSCGLKHSRQLNDWVFETPNSWGMSWGRKGHCFVQRAHFNPAYGFGFDAFALMYTNANPEDVADIPDVQ